MPLLSTAARFVLKHPFGFARQVLAGFARNQCLLLAGAIAYYALLSVLPLTILSVILLSHLVDQAQLLATLGSYLEWLVPSQSRAVLADVSRFLDNRAGLGALLLGTLLFFSSLAFSALEKSMAVIFAHRDKAANRHLLVSAVLPYCFVLVLAVTLLCVTGVSIVLQAVAGESLQAFGHDWSLRGFSGVVLYLFGFTVESLILTAIYLVVPVGTTRLLHGLIGGFSATILWESIRHGLVWYFATLSKASVVYGSLTTAVVALFSMELAATIVLLGAQVIAQYERLDRHP